MSTKLSWKYPITKKGERDMRYNRKFHINKNGNKTSLSSEPEFGFPRNKDGRRDMRYKEKCYLKKDGTPDNRYIHPHIRTKSVKIRG